MTDVIDQTALEALAQVQRLTERSCGMVDALVEQWRQEHEPVRIIPVLLEATNPIKGDASGETFGSVGVYNTHATATVQLGLARGTATATQQAIPIGPRTLVVLPLLVQDVELGALPGDIATPALCFLFRFPNRQDPYIGRGG